MDIVAVGRRRYRLDQIKSRKTPYLVGSVEFLTCPAGEIDRALEFETLELYNALIEIVYKETKRQLSLDQVTTEASFVLAQKSGMDLLQRQHLLELASENERLQVLRDYLTKVIPKLETMEEVNRVISSDGYL
jgi:Lon protease-like protein